MKKLLILITISMFLIATPSQALAWGPRTHTLIGQQILEADEFPDRLRKHYSAFLLGNILPDMALVFQYRNDSNPVWQERHRKLYSEEFYYALWLQSRSDEDKAFALGYIAHVVSDSIEEVYSSQQIGYGAPCSADYPVDVFIPSRQLVSISQSQRKLIQRTLDVACVEWKVSPQEWRQIERSYNGYFSWFAQIFLDWQYGEIANQWYNSYDSYILDSITEALNFINSLMAKEKDSMFIKAERGYF